MSDDQREDGISTIEVGRAREGEAVDLFLPALDDASAALHGLSGPEQLEHAHARGSRAETERTLAETAVPTVAALRVPRRRLRSVLAVSVGLVVAVVLTVAAIDAAAADSYSAVILPTGAISLTFPSTGLLGGVVVHPGEHVRAGQLLASEQTGHLGLVVRLASKAVRADRSRLAVLRSEPSSATVAAEVAGATAALADDEATLATDRAELATSQLRAPEAGTILSVAGENGALVGPSGVHQYGVSTAVIPSNQATSLFPAPLGGSSAGAAQYLPVISMQTGTGWTVTALVPEGAVASVHPGEAASFAFSALGGATVACRVLSVGDQPQVETGTVDYEVTLVARGALPRGVLPGMSGSVSFG